MSGNLKVLACLVFLFVVLAIEVSGCQKNSDCYNVIECIDATVACVGSECTCINETLSSHSQFGVEKDVGMTLGGGGGDLRVSSISRVTRVDDAGGCHKNSDCYKLIKCIDAKVACVGSKCTCINETLSSSHSKFGLV